MEADSVPIDRRKFAIGALVAALSLGALVAAAVATKSPESSFTLRASLAIPTYGEYSRPCSGGGHYSDVTTGTPITVYDGAGKLIATSTLGDGRQDSRRGPCRFALVVYNVPSGQPFYQVEVAYHGKTTVPADRARSGHLTLALS